jgi:hypothetical protein
MESMSREEMNLIPSESEPVRRRGDRRVTQEDVDDDRRQGDRRDIPGVSALIRMLFRRGTGSKS